MSDFQGSDKKMPSDGQLSNLELVNLCDAFPYPGDPAYHLLTGRAVKVLIEGFGRTTFGMIPSLIAEKIHHTDPTSWRLSPDLPATLTLIAGPDEQARSAAIAKTLDIAREGHVFDILQAWRNELYPVYGPNGELVLKYERAACGLFGFVTYGVVRNTSYS
jgi:Domain of unknown function (DUF4743)